ncbi:hypothetical protein PsYK624_063290 [Phanerochaete sordida]|uniref:Uncharacterized protein n=1 Tax=Phanerochaete sordida TaxID=48140 RepID=A0A9P3G8E7_9APHY|nr:hypothetical protein PsYK624_063290 [Phanerochaete sordida]
MLNDTGIAARSSPGRRFMTTAESMSCALVSVESASTPIILILWSALPARKFERLQRDETRYQLCFHFQSFGVLTSRSSACPSDIELTSQQVTTIH